MGGSEGVDTSSRSIVSDTPRADFFEQQCPIYMAMGMPYDEYWNGDNLAPKRYRKAYEYKRKEKNFWLWLEGAYMYAAIGDYAPFLKAFSREKVQPYLDKPIPITEKEVENNELEQKKKAAMDFAEMIRAKTIRAVEKGGKKDG